MALGVLVVDHVAGVPHASTYEANPYSEPIEGPPNIVAATDIVVPNLSAGAGGGMEVEVNTYYHLESDTYATVGFICLNLMTPNAAANASVSIAWTEAIDASQAAEGSYGSVNAGVGPVGVSKSIALVPTETEEQTSNFWSPQPFSLAPPPPGTTGYSFTFGPSAALASVSVNTCECSVINSGSFEDTYVPWWVNIANIIHDRYEPQ